MRKRYIVFAKFRLGQHHFLLILKQPDKQVMQIHYKRLQEKKKHLYLLEKLHINKILQNKMVISLN